MKKTIENFVVGLLIVILVAQVLSILPASVVNASLPSSEFQASYSTSPPFINGSLNDEWDDANSYAISLSGGFGTNGTVPATVYFKHDGTNIYLGLKVFAGDHDFDQFLVYFDEGDDGLYGSGTHDGILKPNQEDLKACFSPSINGSTIEDGCYKGWWYGYWGGDFAASCGFVGGHWECEFSIPFVGNDEGVDVDDVSDLVCGITDTIGIKFQYFTQPDANNYFYPAGDQYQIANYTTLGFSLAAASGITIKNKVVGVPPSSPWNYIIANADTNEIIEDFTLSSGGSITFSDPVFKDGGNFLVIETPKFGYYLDISAEIYSESSWSETVNSTAIFLHLASDDYIGVTFTNTAMPAFAVQSVGSTPPSDLNFQIPALTPIPVQAGWSVDINPPSGIDLVRGKPTAILVNVTNTYRLIGASEQVNVTVQFEGNTYTNVTTGSQIAADSIISIWNKAITPPSTAGTNKQITGTYKIGTDNPTDLTSTNFAVKNVPDLSLYYAPLSKSAYGSENESAYNLMVANSAAFVKATYPVKNVTINARYSSNGISGTNNMLKDATNIAKAAKLAFPNSNAVGIGIGPSNTGKLDYFAFQGYPGAAGVSFGPSVKGVIALDGYYTAAAHEVAHTYGLYWGVPEQYQEYPLNGKTASGVWADKGQWRTGYSFMGTAPYKTLDFSWVDSDTTYKTLFSSMATNPADPEILVANGLIYKDGTVELAPWYHVQAGTPDTLTPGDYALVFVDAQNKILASCSFDASFFMQIDPGINVGENAIDVGAFGKVDTDVAGFAFATVYPQGTAAVQVVNMVDPQNPVVLATVSATNIINYGFSGFFQPINNDGSSIFKLGSTVPVKFQLRDILGNFISTATANIYVTKITNNVEGTDMEAVSTSAATTGNLFRYDSTSNQYIFNLSTKSLSKGTWQIKVILDDGTQKTVIISLK